jgi:hypothetical protein
MEKGSGCSADIPPLDSILVNSRIWHEGHVYDSLAFLQIRYLTGLRL